MRGKASPCSHSHRRLAFLAPGLSNCISHAPSQGPSQRMRPWRACSARSSAIGAGLTLPSKPKLPTLAPHKSHICDLTIPLSREEQRLFALLLTVAEEDKTTLRVAGGWVRDKLLKAERGDEEEIPAHKLDIDIALDNCLGREFAERVNGHLLRSGREIHGVGIMGQNPEKSKHLETATMQLGGFWIDFVNLRTESYSLDSRIPNMGIGTPEEDAYRRDLTINSLFYNINSGKIEDFTGRGAKDLAERVVCTPLAPAETLLDDPLRVLRAIRFAGRFGFTMSPGLLEACRDPLIHQALALKISRERVGQEVELMIRSHEPLRAFKLIADLHLAPEVFPLPPDVEGVDSSQLFHQGLEYLSIFLKILNKLDPGPGDLVGLNPDRDLANEERRLALYASLLLPYSTVMYQGRKSRRKATTRFIMKKMLMMRAKDVDQVEQMQSTSREFRSLLDRVDMDLSRVSRSELGLLVRKGGKLWQLAFLLALTQALASSTGARASRLAGSGESQSSEVTQGYLAAGRAIVQAGLHDAWDMKPLFDGKEVAVLLPHVPKGPLYSQVMQAQIVWQMDHPGEGPEWEEQARVNLRALFPL
ncbi:unnamed protein product, partial [Chrysoparadoxa australica]